MKILLILSVLSFSSASLAKNASCSEAYLMASRGSEIHLSNPPINGDLIARALPVYLDLKDPSKNYLTKAEADALIADLSVQKDAILNNIKKNDCQNFETIDVAVAAGKERWMNLIRKNLEDPEIIKAEEVVRDSVNLVAFNEVSEIEKFARFYIASILKNEVEVLKKPLVEAKKDFNKKLANKEKESEPDALIRGNLLARSLFLSFDPHSDYISEKHSTEFEADLRAEMDGIGVGLKSDDLGAKIISVVKNGPSDRNSQKLKKGDLIVKADNVPLSGKSISNVVQLIRGKKGTIVKLDVIRKVAGKSEHLKVNITRDSIALENRKVKGKVITVSEKKVLLINLPSFYYNEKTKEGAASDIVDTYNAHAVGQKIDAVILDLRYNGGGSLDEAVRVSGLFIEKPIAVQVKTVQGVRLLKSSKAPLMISQPMVVLINKFSASASEIVAGALKDYNRAVIVGDERTFGKGTVQSVFTNFRGAELGIIKVTSAKFYTPGGSSTQIKGITSDIVLPSPSQLKNFGELNQRYALPWSEVPKVIEVHPNHSLINDLKSRSSKRVSKDTELQNYTSEEKYKKWMESKPNKEQKEDAEEDDEESLEFSKLMDPLTDPILKETLQISVDLAKIKSNK